MDVYSKFKAARGQHHPQPTAPAQPPNQARSAPFQAERSTSGSGNPNLQQHNTNHHPQKQQHRHPKAQPLVLPTSPHRNISEEGYGTVANNHALVLNNEDAIDLENAFLPALGEDELPALVSPSALLEGANAVRTPTAALLENFPSWDMDELEKMGVGIGQIPDVPITVNSNSSSQTRFQQLQPQQSVAPQQRHSGIPPHPPHPPNIVGTIPVKEESYNIDQRQQQPTAKQRFLASFTDTGKRMKSAGLEQEQITNAPGMKRKITPVGARMSGAGGMFRIHAHDKDAGTPSAAAAAASAPRVTHEPQLYGSITDPNVYYVKTEPIPADVTASEISGIAQSYATTGENESLIAGMAEFEIGGAGPNAPTTPEYSSLDNLRAFQDRSEEENNPATRRQHRRHVRLLQRMKQSKIPGRALSEPGSQRDTVPDAGILTTTSPGQSTQVQQQHSGGKQKVFDAEKEKFRLLRNREAAMRSRKEKKEQMLNLEMENEFLKTDVALLKDENMSLKSELEALRKAFNLDGGGLGSVGVGSGNLNIRALDARQSSYPDATDDGSGNIDADNRENSLE